MVCYFVLFRWGYSTFHASCYVYRQPWYTHYQTYFVQEIQVNFWCIKVISEQKKTQPINEDCCNLGSYYVSIDGVDSCENVE